MTIRIRRAEASDAAALTDIAHAAKRHWNYPEEWIRLWADELTVNTEYIDTHPVYVAEENARLTHPREIVTLRSRRH